MSLVLAGTVAATIPGILAAQAIVAVADGALLQTSRPSPEKTAERRVTVALRNLPLSQAIDKVAAASGVEVAYSKAVLAKSANVTMQITNSTIRDALEQLLRGTLFAVTSYGGQLAIVEASQVPGRRREGTIVGKVLHAKTKLPVVGARIVVDDTASGVSSGEDGTFRISASAGEHKVHVRAVGFTRMMKSVTVVQGETVTIEVVLEPSASVLDQVIVTGTVAATQRREIPNPITVITAEDIEKRGITRIEELMRGDIPGVIALERGVATYSSSASGGLEQLGGLVTSTVYARGSSGLTTDAAGSPTPLKTFVDGVELFDASYLGTIDPRSIERIEVIVGPQAATIYGAGAMGGVMQIFTKKGSGTMQHELTANLRYGMLQSNFSSALTPTHNHTIGLRGSVGATLSYSTTLSYDYVGQWQPDLFSRRLGASAGASARFTVVTINASASVSTTGNGASGATGRNLSGMANYLKFKSGEYEPDYMTGTMTKRVSRTSSQTLSLNADHQITSWWRQSATVGRSQNHFQMVPTAPAFIFTGDTLYRTGESVGARTNWSYNSAFVTPSGRIASANVAIGMNGSTPQGHRFTVCAVSTDASVYMPCATSGVLLNQVRKTASGNSWGGFTNLRLGVFDRLYFTFGLRGEHNTNYGRDHKIDWTPTNGVAYSMDRGDLTVKLLASYGRATKSPPPDARRDSTICDARYAPQCVERRRANPAIGPEYSRGPQGGIELYWGNRLALTINHYRQRITELLTQYRIDSLQRTLLETGAETNALIFQWNNNGVIRQYGWEGTGAFNLGRFSVQGTYSWNEGRIESFKRDGNAAAVNPSPRFHVGGSFGSVPPHVGTFRVTYAHRGASVSISNSFIGRSLRATTLPEEGHYSYNDLVYARLRMYGPVTTTIRSAGNRLGVNPGYNKANLAASQRINSWASFTVNVINLGNNISSDQVDSPALGRQTSIGVSLRHPLGQ